MSDLEQRDTRETAIGILLRAGHQPGNEARPHVGQIRRDRIGEREFRLPAAEQLRLLLADERPRYGLDHRASRERALGLAVAHLQRREDRLARVLATWERHRRHLVDADDAHDLLDDVGFALDIGPP